VSCDCNKLRSTFGEWDQSERALPNFPQSHVSGLFYLFFGLRGAYSVITITCNTIGFSDIFALDYPIGRKMVRKAIWG
jgi:hypothetical protein